METRQKRAFGVRPYRANEKHRILLTTLSAPEEEASPDNIFILIRSPRKSSGGDLDEIWKFGTRSSSLFSSVFFFFLFFFFCAFLENGIDYIGNRFEY